jgi:hypothetical protein
MLLIVAAQQSSRLAARMMKMTAMKVMTEQRYG